MSLRGEIIDYRGTLIHVPRNLESESVPLAASSSSLLWWRGRGYNVSLTWDQPIANHNHLTSCSASSSSKKKRRNPCTVQ